MKTIVLCYDGLEYTLVQEWKMKNLMQEHYGTYKADISPVYNMPYTPTCWTTIFTGMPQEEHKVYHWWKYSNLIMLGRKLLPKFIKRRFNKKLRRFLVETLGIKPRRMIVKEDLPETVKRNFIFEQIDKAVPLFIPCYNEQEDLRKQIEEVFSSGRTLEDYYMLVWKLHSYRKKIFFEELEKGEFNLLAVWFDIADLLGHVFICKDPLKLRLAYRELDIITRKVREMYPNANILIISDHGMKPTKDKTGVHTDYGFWSLNVKPPIIPQTTIDINRLIKLLCGVEK